MNDITIPAPYAGCRQCARYLSAVLRDVPGVVAVRVDPVSGAVTVSGDVSQADLATALAAADYGGSFDPDGRPQHPRQHGCPSEKEEP